MKLHVYGLFIALGALVAALPRLAQAHCPLCVGAVAGAAATASFFGFNPAVVGVFIGAFGVVSGLWLARAVKHKFVPFQSALFTLLAFVLTVWPAIYSSPAELFLPVHLLGSPGTVLNTIYWVNYLLLGSILGGAVTLAAEAVHFFVKQRHGVLVPFQGVLVTVALVVITAGGAQLLFGG